MPLAQMCVIVIALSVKRTDSYSPAAESVPAGMLDISALNRDNRCADTAYKVVPQMIPAVSEGAGVSEIVE